MKYFFSDFIFDTEKKQLSYQGKPVQLTKNNYNLLAYLLNHSHQIHTKDELVEHVWQGRVVTDNTVDQSILKLRNILSNCQPDNYIETVYGRGVKFKPKVSESEPQKYNLSHHPIIWATTIGVLLLIGFGWSLLTPTSSTHINKPQILIKTTQDNGNWLQSGTETMFSQVLNYSGVAQVVDINNRPKYVETEQFINNQLTLKPQLQTIQTSISKLNGNYRLEISIQTPERDLNQQFNHSDLGQLMADGMQWVTSQTTDSQTKISQWMPATDHVMELYLRAMDSLHNNQFEKARKQLEVVLIEDPDFELAKYQMAQVLAFENKHDASMALLDTLLQLPINDELTVATTSLKASILDTLGQHDESMALYEQLFKNDNNHSLARLNARYEFSQALYSNNQATQAITQLDIILSQLKEAENTALLADVSVLKGSILQRLGHIPEAQNQLIQALNLYQLNEDALGTARTYSTLARIANHQAKYELAESYLQESLAITRGIGFRLGEGATLNELAYVKFKQGQLNKGQELAQKMQQIGIEIDYSAMQITAQQYLFDVARAKGNWDTAERYLQQHHQLAEATDNARAKIKNKMLALNLYVDSRQPDLTTEIIKSIQQHIDSENEVRMQPRLDWLKARIDYQQNNYQQAKILLNQAKQQALKQEDGETLIEINNTLAEILLSENQPQKALSTLNESTQLNPFAMPYLKLKAHAHQAMGNPVKALELMNLCKLKSADFWTPTDNDYLKELITEVNQLQQ